MGIGTLTSMISALFVSKLKARQNAKGVTDSNGIFGSYLIPGFIAGALSAIFQASGANNYGKSYTANFDSSRTRFGQGAVQIAGAGIAIGLGVFAGLIGGLLMKVFN